MNLWIFSALILFASSSHGLKILFVTPFKGKSHWLFMKIVIDGLLNRHHEVTCITSFKWSGTKPENYTEILVDPPLNIEDFLPQSKIFEAEVEIIPNFIGRAMMGKLVSDHCLNNSNVQKFIHRNDLSFDLVINEEFFMDSLLMFGHKFNAPLVAISTYGYSDFFDRQFGLLTPWSHVPYVIFNYSDNMSFLERLHNAVISACEWIVRRFVHLPFQNEIAQKYFGHLGELPSMDDLVKNVSVMLINTHRSVIFPRPTMPGTVYIGGAHIKEPKPLPTEVQQFLDDASDGAIFFSFGTVVQSSEMPPERLKMFLDVMKQLKQRVLWKYDDESIKNLPSNVMIRKWLPQNDILAHKNVVLFISHGGMFGHFESLYRGVPLIMIPFFGDQFRNAERSEKTGYAKHLDFKELTNDLLLNTIREITTNKTYSNKAKEISAIFRDNLVHPLDEAIWWIEHVANFRGAKHLKSHAVNMNWFSYLLLDVIGVIILSCTVAILLMYFAIKSCLRRLFRNKSTDQTKKKN